MVLRSHFLARLEEEALSYRNRSGESHGAEFSPGTIRPSVYFQLQVNVIFMEESSGEVWPLSLAVEPLLRAPMPNLLFPLEIS